MNASISIDSLSKSYDGGKTLALNKLSLQVQPGEVYGFLGANGAGKSTTIRLLLNFIQPSGGSAQIMGLDCVKDSVAAKRHIGYLSGDVALWPKVTGTELFAYLSKLQQKNNDEYLKELISRFEAEPQKKIEELSKGNRQKIGVIQALMHQPDVLILDEPTSGLDPLMQEVFYQTIREASARGAAVFVSSHNLAETQRMCDRVGIIKHGKLIREQSVKGDSNLGGTTFRVVLKHPDDAAKLKHEAALKVLSTESTTVVAQATGAVSPALAALAHYDIVTMTTEQLNLEDEFLEYYGDGA
jgi:ABC-2 type transport system ATP-binding protein